MNRPIISICVPTYNRGRFIGQALRSVLNQGIEDIELLVFDNASEDDTEAVVREIAAQDSRVVYQRHACNLGIHANTWLALRAGRGKYRVWLHSDDWMLPGHLASHLAALEAHSNCVLAYSPCFWANEEGHIARTLFHPGHLRASYFGGRNEVADLLLNDCYLTPVAVVFRAEALNTLVIPESLCSTAASDWYIYVHLALQSGADFAFLRQPSTVYRLHGGQDSEGFGLSDRPLHSFLEALEAVVDADQFDFVCGSESRLLHILDARVEMTLKLPAVSIPKDRIARCRDWLSMSRPPKLLPVTPLISIIVPTHNRPELLQDTLHSLFDQTYPRWEAIIVDDAGESVEALVAALNNGGRLRYVRHGINHGLSAARNTGLALARGEIICFLDDDDRFLPDHLETVVSALREPGIEFVYTNALYIRELVENGQRKELAHSEPFQGVTYSREHLLVENFIPVNTWALRRQLALRAGPFEETYTALEDWEFLLRLTALTEPKQIEKTTVEVRIRTDINQHMSVRERVRFLPLFRQIYERHPSRSATVQANRELMLAALERQQSEVLVTEKPLPTLDYSTWRDRHRWSASMVARLADQVIPMVEAGAGVHLLVVATSNDNTAVADTIDTLATQGSSGWRLTVISPYSCPDPLFETIPALAWVQLTAAEELPVLLEQTIKSSAMNWFMVCAPGARFEPAFVSLALVASAQHPDWRCIYFDEERLDNEGHPSNPWLKPDINLELLRSSAYVGQAVLVHRALWPVLDHRLAVWPRAFAFDAVLRALEADGENAIGHIDELVMALQKEADGQIEDWVSLARGLLEAHLSRTKEPAEIRPGLLPDTFFVDYALTRRPLVSIIVPTKDRIDLLKPCLESLLEKTKYREFEVLVVDNDSTDPATLDYLKTVTQQDVRVKVLPYAAPYNFSAINNSAAEIAKGEFLVLLNNDTVVIQPNWLDRMLAHGLREGVGVVGCRLLFPNGRVQHAGVVLGLYGVADHVGFDLPMDAPGHLGRAQQVQNFSAVTAACLLIRRDLYLELGGLDEQRFPVLFNDADLCLKAQMRGLHVVWTPFATLIHHGSSSRLVNNPNSRRLEDERRQAAHAFSQQWLPWQVADPAYNHHLSLLELNWSLDGIHDVPWNPKFEALPCIFAAPYDAGSTSHYRIRDPLTSLENAAVARCALLPNHDQIRPEFLDPIVLERTGMGVFLFQDTFNFDWIETIHKVLPHRRIVLSQNDAMAMIAGRTDMNFASEDAEILEQAGECLRRTLSFCDRLIVANEELADAFRNMIEDIRIVPNYLPRWRWEHLASNRGRGAKPRVGWVGDVEQQGDLEFMLPVVEATRYEVDWVFVGACSERLRSLIAEFHPGVQFKDYPAQLAGLDLDLAVAPFEHSRFAAAKNRLRLLEYSVLGWSVICSDSGFYYPDAPFCRVPNHPQAWIEAIRKRVHDRPATWEEGDRLQTWVLDHWMLEDHLEEWRQALLEGFSATLPVEPTIPTISKAAKPSSIDAKDSSVEITDYRLHGAEESIDKQVLGPAVLPKEPHRLGTAMDVTQLLISVIICSSDNERFARVTRNYRDLLIEVPHEIIRIDDATSLCEGYNRGIARSRGDYLIFSHDDIEIWTPDFAQRLLRHLERCDLVGVVGTNLLVDTGGHSKLWKYTSWGAAGLGHVFGRIVQPQGEDYAVVVYGTPAVLIEGIQALDGVFIAVRRQVVESLRFDEETFDGFHVYDLDFCYRAFQKGFHLGVFTDIAIVHESAGNYDEQYFDYHRRFLKKFEGILPKRRPYAWQHAFMVFQRADEVLTFYQGVIQGMPAIATASNKTGNESREAVELSDVGLYRRWCERQQVGEGWAEIVGERMVKCWQAQPTFHLVVWCEPGQTAALAETLESLGRQLYGQWGVSVLAPFDGPEGGLAELPNVEWVKIEADADAALRRVLDESALGWFALLEPGDRLASHALLKIADYINRYPTWRFIYLDEDQLDLRGERRDPVFRPEFDLDLLLSTHYLGDCCLMHRESVLADGDLPYLPGLTTFQAALRVWERHGRSAIGHIADVLYHRTVARLPAADAGAVARARQQLVTDYLARHGVAATVEATLLYDAWRVVYHHSRQPKVSIIVLTKDALDRLDRCLRKLLTKTAYPDYEVLVVDCGSEAEDTLDLYAELEERYPERFRTVTAKAPFSVSAYRNQGARQARGEVLIFLTGSALVVQDDWIDRLLNHALRDDVGIVGARMTTPDATRPFVYGTAQLLGMRGLTGPLFAGLSLKAPGPLGRAQVDQTVSAVSADCLAIRREVFEALCGFDEAFTVSHADTDLCLRAAARGYRTLWTPFANLAWLGEYPLAAGAGYSHHELVEWARADSERMFERWLPQLASDPAYNPNLSLVEPHRIEVELAPGWDTTFHDRPRVLGFPADETGCALYRIYAPLWLLEHQARAECTLVKSGTRPPELTELERLAPDTVFYQGMIADLGIAAMRQYRRFHGSFKVFDLDDLKHNVPDANSLKERLIRDVKYRHRQALQQCDRLIVSTEPLAEACRPWITDIRVVPNRLEQARWGHLQNRRRVGAKPRVGWAGAQQHHGDLAFITDVVKQTHEEVDWVFFGMCLDEVRPYVKEVHDWVHLNNYPTKLASLDLDLAVAPLEHHPFNEAKSNLRILEHGILGRPMVCTDIYPYRNAPVKRVPNETGAWVEAIRERVHDLDAAECEGDTLRAWVLEHYILDDHTDEWLSALRP